MGGADGRISRQRICAGVGIGVTGLLLAHAELSSCKKSKLNASLRCSCTEEFEVSHPSRKNKDAARVGHPDFIAIVKFPNNGADRRGGDHGPNRRDRGRR